jgi:hypothetical protein
VPVRRDDQQQPGLRTARGVPYHARLRLLLLGDRSPDRRGVHRVRP